MQFNPATIILDSIDRCGKDTVRRTLVKQSGGNYLVIVRSVISQVAYARIYNRTIDEEYFFNQGIQLQKLGHIFIYLKADDQLIAQRIKDTNELHITENDIAFHKEIFQQVLFDFRKKGLMIAEIDTTDQDLNRIYKECEIAILLNNIQQCQGCYLRNQTVNKKNLELGYGKLIADVRDFTPKYLIVGMNPSKVRDPGCQYPFQVDYKGKNEQFRGILAELGILENCVITNLVKCSTAEGFNLNDAWVHCQHHIKKEIEFYQPEIIIALGKDVYKKLLSNKLFNPAKIIEIYHPAYCYSRHSITHSTYKQHIYSRLK